MGKPKDYTGYRFGTLVAVRNLGAIKNSLNCYWECHCDCGNIIQVISHKIRTQKTCRLCRHRNTERVKSIGKDLYIIRAGGFIKIGHTIDLKRRLKAIQIGCPYELEVLYYGTGEGEREHELHEAAAQWHHRGEWFSAEALTCCPSLAEIQSSSRDA